MREKKPRELGKGPREGGRRLGDLSGTGRVSRQEVYSGRIVNLSLDVVRFPNGQVGTLEHITHPGASAVLAFLDPPTDEDPRILLLRQYRYAAGGAVYEVPAGMPDSPEESWEGCARRELQEETGFEVEELRYLGSILTTPGFTDERIHVFAATGLSKSSAQHDDDEFLEVVTPRFSEALEGVCNGEIQDAKSVFALLFTFAFLDRVWEEGREVPAR